MYYFIIPRKTETKKNILPQYYNKNMATLGPKRKPVTLPSTFSSCKLKEKQ